MNVVEDLNWRYACKKFDPTKKLTDEQFNTIKEALRLTPSSFGLQPWNFVIVEDPKKREELVAASWNQNQVKDASHMIVMCAPTVIDEAFLDRFVAQTAKARGQQVEELEGFKKMIMMVANWDAARQQAWAKNQIYIALGNLMTVCAAMRVDCCPMEGFKAAEYDKILGLTEMGLTSIVLAPVGYRAEDDKYAKLSKVRFPQEQIFTTI